MKHVCYTVVNNPVLIDSRAIIPTAMRSHMLAALHRSHGSVEDIRARVRDAMFWLGMNNDIQRVQEECEACRQTAPSQTATPPNPLAVP